jgi:hypothetical protein
MSSVLSRDELKAQLDQLKQELDDAISAAEEEVQNKLDRLRAIQDALGQSELDSASDDSTLQWYDIFDQFFFPQEQEA